jgi:hypothetical protein
MDAGVLDVEEGAEREPDRDVEAEVGESERDEAEQVHRQM